MSQFSTYSCVSDGSDDVEKLLYSQLVPVVGPAPSCMLLSGDSETKREPMLSIAMEMKSDIHTNTKVCSVVRVCVCVCVYMCVCVCAVRHDTASCKSLGYLSDGSSVLLCFALCRCMCLGVCACACACVLVYVCVSGG